MPYSSSASRGASTTWPARAALRRRACGVCTRRSAARGNGAGARAGGRADLDGRSAGEGPRWVEEGGHSVDEDVEGPVVLHHRARARVRVVGEVEDQRAVRHHCHEQPSHLRSERPRSRSGAVSPPRTRIGPAQGGGESRYAPPLSVCWRGHGSSARPESASPRPDHPDREFAGAAWHIRPMLSQIALPLLQECHCRLRAPPRPAPHLATRGVLRPSDHPHGTR